MTNKMAARNLFYAQGLPSYGDLNGAKYRKTLQRRLPGLLGWLMVIRCFFGCNEEWFLFQQELIQWSVKW